MGFNSLVFILNDAFHAIDEHPDIWWRATKRALDQATAEPKEYDSGLNKGNFTAVLNHHADVMSLVAVGGNDCSIIWQEHFPAGRHAGAEEHLEILKKAADALGFRLVKKSKKKLLHQAVLEEVRLRTGTSRRTAAWIRYTNSKLALLKRLM